MKKQVWLGLLMSMFLAFGAIGCSVTESQSSSETPSVAITLNKNEVELELYQEYWLSADYDGEEALMWSVSDTSVVSVQNGKIVGFRAGTATVTVTVTAGSHTASCDVTVLELKQEKLSLELEKTYISLYKDDEAQIMATVKYDGMEISSTAQKSYQSTNSEIVSVDENGKLNGKSLGNATISVVYTIGESEISGSVNVKVVSIVPQTMQGNTPTPSGNTTIHSVFDCQSLCVNSFSSVEQRYSLQSYKSGANALRLYAWDQPTILRYGSSCAREIRK